MNKIHRSLLCALTLCSVASVTMAAEAPAPPTAPAAIPAPAPVAAPVKPAETPVPQATTHLGYVDMARVAAESETGKSGKSELLEMKKKLQGQIDSKRKQLDKMRSSLEASFKTLSPQQREAKAKEFQKKVDDFQKFGQNAEKQLQEKEMAFTDKLYKAIEQASADLGKAKGLALVVIKRELLFLNNGVDAQDVTDEMIRKVDKK